MAAALAITLVPAAARAYEPGVAASGVDLAPGTASGIGEALPEVAGPREPGPDLSDRRGEGAAEATGWAAEGQRRRGRGDIDGAIAAWQSARAALPMTQATAHRRAGLALAIAAAHAEAARRQPARLREAIAVLDAYLAGLEPTDDENRVAVEQRRAELAAGLGPGPAAGRVLPPPPPRGDRRLRLAGGVSFGLGGVGVVVLTAGLLAGVRADNDLARAVALAGDDPTRTGQREAAVARGLRANRTALAGGIIGGVWVVAGAALMIVGTLRQAPGGARRGPTLGAEGLMWRF